MIIKIVSVMGLNESNITQRRICHLTKLRNLVFLFSVRYR